MKIWLEGLCDLEEAKRNRVAIVSHCHDTGNKSLSVRSLLSGPRGALIQVVPPFPDMSVLLVQKRVKGGGGGGHGLLGYTSGQAIWV